MNCENQIPVVYISIGCKESLYEIGSLVDDHDDFIPQERAQESYDNKNAVIVDSIAETTSLEFAQMICNAWNAMYSGKEAELKEYE